MPRTGVVVLCAQIKHGRGNAVVKRLVGTSMEWQWIFSKKEKVDG